MENSPDMEQLIQEIEIQFKNFKEKISTAKKMKGKKRIDFIESVKDKDFKRIRTYINHLQTSINCTEQSMDEQSIKHQRGLVQQFKVKLEKYIKKLQSSKNEVMTEDVLFEERIQTKKTIGTDRTMMIKEIDQAQKQSEEAVKRALKNMYEMQGISEGINVELERQINQLDSIYQNLQDTESSMNRALRHINYFARSIYSDKIIMVLITLIIIAIVVIIVLTSMGKIPKAKQDSIF